MPVLIYSLLRLALFAVCALALALVGMGWLFALLLAAVLAALLSYVLLGGPRDSAARWLQQRSAARGDRPRLPAGAARDAAVEDDVVDRAAGDADDGRTGDAPAR